MFKNKDSELIEWYKKQVLSGKAKLPSDTMTYYWFLTFAKRHRLFEYSKTTKKLISIMENIRENNNNITCEEYCEFLEILGLMNYLFQGIQDIATDYDKMKNEIDYFLSHIRLVSSNTTNTTKEIVSETKIIEETNHEFSQNGEWLF